MNRREHLAIGIIAFLVYKYLLYLVFKISNEAILYALIAVILGSIIPDILEPPTSWMHRNAYHSKSALKLCGKAFALTAFIGLFFSIFYVISSFFLGYTFHLLADSTTEVGLPD